ncbi:MAG: hypothetical protein ACM3O5_03120 [Betaproteobacteria bacterium]
MIRLPGFLSALAALAAPSALQALAGVGYSFGWGDVVAAWRYIDSEMKSGKAVEDINFSGPGVAAVLRW